jgi:hypothetical protein
LASPVGIEPHSYLGDITSEATHHHVERT